MTFRIEKKIFIKKENFFEFRKKLLSNNAKTLYEPRKIESVYFDNVKKQMFYDSIEGLTPRKKLRVRNYPDEKKIKFLLENKISSIEGRFKNSIGITRKYYELIKLKGIFDSSYGLCKPILNIIYNREYLKKDDVRITLDSDISYNLTNNKTIKKDANIIVELKTSINKNLDDLFEEYPFQEIRFSKYCNGIGLFNKY
jgi:hypothetical protein|tara:strand:- start:105 stop:698 length:594 start_codon:yes stop_codon:yes gene_type:complete